MRASVGKRVIFMFLVLVLIITAHNLVLFRFFTATESYGPFLELAGRQRFLAQRLGVLIERAFTTQDVRAANAVDATMRTFEEALTVFERGGDTVGRSYPPAPAEISNAVQSQRNAWNRLRSFLDERAPGATGVLADGSVERAASHVEALTASSFTLVEALERWRENLQRNLLYSVFITSGIAIVTLIAALRLSWSKIVAPVRALRDEVVRVSEVGFAGNRDDEIGLVSTAVARMSESVGRLRNERTRVEQKLRRVEADYRSVFDNAVAGIFQFDGAGNLTLANPAMARILGYDSPNELARVVGNVHRDLFVDPHHETRVRELSRTGGTIESQTRMFRKDGSVLWALESSAIVRSDGRNYCCESVVVDVTEMKRAQQGLKELSGLLLDSQDQERRRIARELHDSTGQLLAALEMSMGRLKDVLGGAFDSVEQTSELAAQCSREIRSMSYLLHPPLLDELGLVYAIRDYVAGFGKRAGIDVTLDLPADTERLSQEAETALFRVIQESLTNIHRHAESESARIRLSASADTVVVEIEDDGRGIPMTRFGGEGTPLSGMGVGMRGMGERLRQLGGHLTVTSDANGTVVRGELPRTTLDSGRHVLVGSGVVEKERSWLELGDGSTRTSS